MSVKPGISSSKFAAVFGLHDRIVRTILHEAAVPNTRGIGYSENHALLALAKHFQAQANKNTRSDEVKARMKEIEAQRAEIELGKAIGDLVGLDEGRAMFTALFVEAREMIRKRKDISQKTKVEICDMLANLKMKPL